MEIAKRLNAIIAQLLPFLSQEVSFYCLAYNMEISQYDKNRGGRVKGEAGGHIFISNLCIPISSAEVFGN